MKYSINFIRIELNKIKSVEDARKILASNNIQEKDIKPEKVFSAKEFHKTLFFDASTLYLIAYIKKGESNLTFVPEFYQLFTDSKPLEAKEDKVILSLDTILDKISKTGIGSLSRSEKVFLNESSKK